MTKNDSTGTFKGHWNDSCRVTTLACYYVMIIILHSVAVPSTVFWFHDKLTTVLICEESAVDRVLD